MSENYLYGFQSSTVARYLSSASLPLLIATWRKASLFVAATQIQLFLPAPEVDGLRRNRELRVAAEFPGQVMGKKSRSTGQPKRDEATRAGAEKRSGGGAQSIGSSSLTGGHPSCRTTTTTCPKKQPVEGHSCWFTSGSGSSPHPDETGLPQEAMPPAGRMAKQGEEEHNASIGSRTRSWRVPYCELSWRE